MEPSVRQGLIKKKKGILLFSVSEAKESRSIVYIQPIQRRDVHVHNLLQWVKFKSMLQFSLKVTVITSTQVNKYIFYEAALFCHNSYLLIICIYLLHANELQFSVICLITVN